MSGVPAADGSGFGAHHLPYGVVRVDGRCRPAARIGDFALDLAAAEEANLIDAGGVFSTASSLDPFLAAGPEVWWAVRHRLTELVTDGRAARTVQPLLHRLAPGMTVLPFAVADFVDFSSSEHHVRNVCRLVRPGQPALPENWCHVPTSRHQRAGAVVVSGTPVTRPCGQRLPSDGRVPVFGASTRLDFEAEVGFVVGVPSQRGVPIPVQRFAEHVFGVVLVTDWCARDLQAWEDAPLGPLLGRAFATSMAAWVTPLSALADAWVTAPPQQPPVLDYLWDSHRQGLDLQLAVHWNGTVVSRPSFAEMYWTPAQQLAHLTVTGAPVRTGDLYASGAVSGPRRDQAGTALELTRNGAEPIRLVDGAQRTYLADGDTVTVTATAAGAAGHTITLAEVTGSVLPAPL